ncbi:MAG: hypothetical protein A2248_21755 [Candidatus Raymondbacteria bacterium RIFOXYA2_FULL_49_16]|nr:MAG: hypothetical protein A2248_21755 [Candidatus Raymondbacteria bacterium RIFOXYA2_FULL_49_16]
MDTVIAETTAADSAIAGANAFDTTAADSASAVAMARNSMALSFTFMIPSIREFRELRSPAQNKSMASFIQDAETKFDNNDICWPLGIQYRRALSAVVTAGAGAAVAWTSNANSWTPRDDDSLHSGAYVNTYALRTVQMNVEALFTVNRALVTVQNFDRLYVGFAGRYYPYAGLRTERTDLGKKIDSRGQGWGGAVFLGIERQVGKASSFAGEAGWSMDVFEGFSGNNRRVTNADLYAGGDSRPFSCTVKSLWFRFFLARSF